MFKEKLKSMATTAACKTLSFNTAAAFSPFAQTHCTPAGTKWKNTQATSQRKENFSTLLAYVGALWLKGRAQSESVFMIGICKAELDFQLT